MAERGFDVTVLEQQSDLGGVWRTNHYPGARVDTPSAIYTYADFRRNWADHYGTQSQILDYINQFVDAFDLQRLICFDSPSRRPASARTTRTGRSPSARLTSRRCGPAS